MLRNVASGRGRLRGIPESRFIWLVDRTNTQRTFLRLAHGCAGAGITLTSVDATYRSGQALPATCVDAFTVTYEIKAPPPQLT